MKPLHLNDDDDDDFDDNDDNVIERLANVVRLLPKSKRSWRMRVEWIGK